MSHPIRRADHGKRRCPISTLYPMQAESPWSVSEAERLAISAAQDEACRVLGRHAEWAPSPALEHPDVPSPSELAAMIDHTVLAPTARCEDILKACDEVLEHGFYGICVNPLWVATAARRLSHSPAAIIAVIAFPLGALTSRSKKAEALVAIDDGATELDMVASLGSLRSGDPVGFAKDVEAVVTAVPGVPVKVIIESGLLRDAYERSFASCLAVLAGAAFVKTSTGFAYDTSGEFPRLLGATAEDVAVIASAIGQRAGVKASGGIRTHEQATAMIMAGASRIGTSSGVQIINKGG